MKNEGDLWSQSGSEAKPRVGEDGLPSVGVTTFGRRRGEPQAARWIFFVADGDRN